MSSLSSINHFYDEKDEKIVTHGSLPHWSQRQKIYAITFRLGDAIPTDVIEKYMFECDQCSTDELLKGQREIMLHNKMMEYMDACHGECLLKYAATRVIIEEAFEYLSKYKCNIHAYVIMPNHVHILLDAFHGETVQSIMHTLKRYTSLKINKLWHRSGKLWQREYFDRIIRSESHYAHAITYIRNNPRYCLPGTFSLWINPNISL